MDFLVALCFFLPRHPPISPPPPHTPHLHIPSLQEGARDGAHARDVRGRRDLVRARLVSEQGAKGQDVSVLAVSFFFN